MKKMMITILLFCMITAMLPMTSMAQTGDVLGYAKYTDISAYINHYPVKSYNINDNTAVIAEDLANYGFNVVWNGETRSLSITKNEEATQITPYGTVYKYTLLAGQNSFPYLETDIKTYVNGNLVDSFNIDGKTCIYIDSLAPCGELVWASDIRAIKLWLRELSIMDYAPLEEAPLTTMYARDGRTIVINESEIEAYEAVGWHTSALRAKYDYYPNTDIPTYDSVTGEKLLRTDYGYVYENTSVTAVTDYKNLLMNEFGWSLDSYDTDYETKIVNNTIKKVAKTSRFWLKRDYKLLGISVSFKLDQVRIYGDAVTSN